MSVLCDCLLAPAVPRLTASRRIAVELVADDRNLSLTRREADLALRFGSPAAPSRAARPLGELPYAVYAAAGAEPDALPRAGLDAARAHLPEVRFVERAAGRGGVRHRATRMETLRALVASGAARTLLPCLMGEGDPALVRVGETGVVARPLHFLTHPEDGSAPHIAAAARWIESLFGEAKV